MPAFVVPQSGGPISISSSAAGFTQNSNPYQYYFNSGGVNATPATERFTFTFADGGSFYLTDFARQGFVGSTSEINVAGIPSTADAGFTSTINVIGGATFSSTYDIYDATSNALLVDNFRPQTSA